MKRLKINIKALYEIVVEQYQTAISIIKKNKQKLIQLAFSLIIFAILFVPIFYLLLQSFNSETETLANLYEDKLIHEYSFNTFYLIFITLLFSLILGVIPAWYISNYEFFGRKILDLILYLPLAIPTYIMAFSYSDILSYTGPFKFEYDFLQIEVLGVILAFSLYPYIYTTSRISFSLLGSKYFDLAKNLGLSSFQTFYKVVLPLSKPAIFSGVFLVIMEVLNEYGAVEYFGINTFTIGIFKSWYAYNDTGAAIQLSSILLFIVAFLFFTEKYFNKNKRFTFSKNTKVSKSHSLYNFKLCLVYLICFIPITLAFIIPVSYNLLNVYSIFDKVNWNELYNFTFNSVSLSLLSSIIILIISTYFVYNEKISKSRLYLYLNQFISLGYSVPGAVVGLGVLVIVTSFDNSIENIDLIGGFWMYFFILIYAYIIRFLAVGKSPIQSGLEKYPESYDNSAKTLGLSNFKIFHKVYFPINKYTFFTAIIMVFIDLMKELPITYILRPFNFDTLALQTYFYAIEESIEMSSIYSTMIILICTILLIFLKFLLNKAYVFRN